MKIIKGSDMPYEAASHEDPKSPGVLKRVLARKDDLIPGRVQMINWAQMPAGQTFKCHYHEEMEEVFVIVSGKAEIEIENERSTLDAGDMVIIPPRAKHVMTNTGSEPVNYIVLGIVSRAGGKTGKRSRGYFYKQLNFGSFFLKRDLP